MSKLHIVFGGRVSDPRGTDFTDPANVDFVGVYPDHVAAVDAWRSAARRSIDDAEMKYVIVNLDRAMNPGA